MAYTYEQVFAADPANPSNVAQNAAITIFAPGDVSMTPLTITDPDGQPLANPIPVNANGFGSAFAHATLDRVAWAGGGFTGYFTSYEGMKQEAVAARTAAESAAASAGVEAAAVADAAIGDATAASTAAAASAATAATAAANSAALVNAPADTAIAAAINGNGATKSALNATYGPAFGTGMEYNEDFSRLPNGSFARASTGQEYSQHFTSAEREMKVTGGFASFASTADLGGYSSVLLDKDLEWMGGYFKLTPWSTGGGMVVFAATEEDIKATINAGQGIPRMAAHMGVSPENISVDVNTTKGGSVTPVFNLVFSTPLTADDATIYSAWLALDKKRGIAYLFDPYGNLHTIEDARFSIPSRWMFFESFRSAGAAGKTLGKFAKVQADSRDSGRLAQIAALAKASTKAVAVENMPGSQSDMTLTTTASKVAGTDTTFVVPDSGTVVVTLEALVDVTAAGPVHFGIFDQANALVSVRTVATKPVNGRLSLRLPLTIGQPGRSQTISMCAYLGGTAAAQILLGNYGSPNVYAGASVLVTAT